MGCLLSVFSCQQLDKKRMALLQNADEIDDIKEKITSYSIQNQYINQEKIIVEKPHKDFTKKLKIKFLSKNVQQKIYLTQNQKDKEYYIMKSINKQYLEYSGMQKQFQNEIQFGKECKGKFIQKYHQHFMTIKKCYIILENVQGGNLQSLMKRKEMSEVEIRFYIAEILIALQNIHKYNVIYRNLTPDNVLIDNQGHIKLSDFSICHFGTECNCLNGNIYYQAPEINLIKYQNQLSDYWSLGALMYEMYVGYPPYFHPNINTYKKNKRDQKLVIPNSISESAQQLLRQLLDNDIQVRIQNESIKKVQYHVFFEGLDWELIKKKYIQSPFIPELRSKSDINYYLQEEKQKQIEEQQQIQ
ncbi:unnamed protein product [Paramecium sonneborni]|uniref:Protein kinase domain-containing protein n=1 Tax=Paramecium sonneborni TaxID=65129 RepID=A0A8S1NUT0_9CILI|nr:unnamed protein product [Paramecium sonneborni]